MPFEKPRYLGVFLALVSAAAMPALAQNDVKATILKHLKTSREFTLKVAEQMPESSYGFKLTPPQMSFAQQMVHLGQALSVFTGPFSGAKPDFAKPPSLDKKDVIAFVGKSFDNAIEQVSKITPGQLSKTYQSEDGSMTGLDLLLGMLDHTTHHRASAEMYLRAKGITPTEYEF
jgi:uncharacterized damage-inducible protein DinB